MKYTHHLYSKGSKATHAARLAAGMATIALLLTTVLVACGSEDDLSADRLNPSDHFQPADDDNSEEAQLRRDFLNDTGCFLLFNDTIQHNPIGIDINGDQRYFTETVDLTYSVGLSAYISTHYAFTLLQTIEQKQQAVDFLRSYILPHLTGELRPYSWLVCDVISTWTDTNTSPTKPYAASNQRCVAIATNYLMQRERTDAQKQQLAQRILNVTIGQLATNHAEAFTDFYTYTADYYSREYTSMGYPDKPTTHELRTIGLLSSTSVSSFPTASTDLLSFVQLVMQNTDEQLQRTYANYPIVLQKTAVARRVLTELGYVF